MELEISHTIVFSKNLKEYESGKRFVINQGGARSSKTYSIIQLLIFLCLTTPKLQISIVRKSFPSLRGSVLRDFVEIMNSLNLYDVNKHNKTEQRYIFDNKSSIEFFSIDDAQKVRGRKRDICYCNEANELTFEDFQQLSLRTSKTIFLDFNPSDSDHWIYDLMKDERSVMLKSNYKDNLFLGEEIVKEIENLINVDENYYKIYALGERPIPHSRIYTHFQQYDILPTYTDFCYGIDYGYTHPTALVKIYFVEGDVYVEELLYKSYLTSVDIIKELEQLGIDKTKYIWADYARPEIIEDMRRAGFNMKEAVKDVKDGIMSLKKRRVFINRESVNLWKEYRAYSWKTKGEEILEEPVKVMDDLMDALRYGVYSTDKKGKFTTKYVGFF